MPSAKKLKGPNSARLYARADTHPQTHTHTGIQTQKHTHPPHNKNTRTQRPEFVLSLTNLRILSLANNGFTSVPVLAYQLPALENLLLYDSPIPEDQPLPPGKPEKLQVDLGGSAEWEEWAEMPGEEELVEQGGVEEEGQVQGEQKTQGEDDQA